MRQLKDQATKLEELRASADELLKVDNQMKEDIEINMKEGATLLEAIDASARTTEQLKVSISDLRPPRQADLPRYRAPRYFVGEPPRTASFRLGTTAYCVTCATSP